MDMQQYEANLTAGERLVYDEARRAGLSVGQSQLAVVNAKRRIAKEVIASQKAGSQAKSATKPAPMLRPVMSPMTRLAPEPLEIVGPALNRGEQQLAEYNAQRRAEREAGKAKTTLRGFHA